MSILPFSKAASRNRYHCQAFTLPGLQVAAVIFLIVVAAALATHIFGIKMMQVVETNKGISDKTRIQFKRLESELRDARKIDVGNWDGKIFSVPLADTRQAGNSVMIFTNDNTNVFIRYFRDTQIKSLIRQVSTEAVPKTIATDIGNAEVFTVEDAFGNVVTNLPGKRVIGVLLQFTKVEAGTSVGKGQAFESFELKSKIAYQAW